MPAKPRIMYCAVSFMPDKAVTVVPAEATTVAADALIVLDCAAFVRSGFFCVASDKDMPASHF